MLTKWEGVLNKGNLERPTITKQELNITKCLEEVLLIAHLEQGHTKTETKKESEDKIRANDHSIQRTDQKINTGGDKTPDETTKHI